METQLTESRGVIGEPTVAPSRMWAIITLLRTSEDGIDMADVERALMPTARLSEQGGRAMLGKNLLEAREARLVEEVDGRLRLAPDVPDALLTPTEEPLAALAQALFEDASGRNDALGYALAWLLDQDPYASGGIGEWQEVVRRMSEEQVDGLTRVTNSATYSAFAAWATWLGFAHGSPLGDGGLIPDPTPHLRVVLPSLLKPGEEVPFAEAIRRVSARVPVLEEGRYRDAVLQDRPANHLSLTSSLAWMRLEDEGLIELSQPSDADVTILVAPDTARPVSLLTLRTP